jgi:hypothetical protein
VSLRDVRPTDDFYRDLDRVLAGVGHGAMSRTDVGLYVLPGILGRFATGWDLLPMPIPGRMEYRVNVGYSPQLGAYSVEGHLARDGAIELTSLAVDENGLTDPDEPADDT